MRETWNRKQQNFTCCGQVFGLAALPVPVKLTHVQPFETARRGQDFCGVHFSDWRRCVLCHGRAALAAVPAWFERHFAGVRHGSLARPAMGAMVHSFLTYWLLHFFGRTVDNKGLQLGPTRQPARTALDGVAGLEGFRALEGLPR